MLPGIEKYKRRSPTTREQNRIIHAFVCKELLRPIVEHALPKLTPFITAGEKHVDQLSECWTKIYQPGVRKRNPRLDTIREPVERLMQELRRPVSGLEEHITHLSECIRLAMSIIRKDADTIDLLWKYVPRKRAVKVKKEGMVEVKGDDVGKNDGAEDMFDVNTSNKSCPLSRFTKKLAGYYQAGYTITKSLLLLSCKIPGQASIKLLAQPEVKGWEPKTAEEVGVHGSFTEFSERYREVKRLRKDTIECLEKTWRRMMDPRNMVYVHAEMKLALHYATHPNIRPHHCVLGVSREVCLCCDEYLT
jgi:OTT_1508-like deaminase